MCQRKNKKILINIERLIEFIIMKSPIQNDQFFFPDNSKVNFQEIIQALEVPGDTPFFPTSAVKGTGREEMLGWVEELLLANDDLG